MKIKRDRRRETITCYQAVYFDPTRNYSFSFDCDKDGNVNLEELAKHGTAYENYQAIQRTGICHGITFKTTPEIQDWSHDVTHAAIGECQCGGEVYLEGFTNTCEQCGADYNLSGQRLAPRAQWCEETWPEQVADVLQYRNGDVD